MKGHSTAEQIRAGYVEVASGAEHSDLEDLAPSAGLVTGVGLSLLIWQILLLIIVWMVR